MPHRGELHSSLAAACNREARFFHRGRPSETVLQMAMRLGGISADRKQRSLPTPPNLPSAVEFPSDVAFLFVQPPPTQPLAINYTLCRPRLLERFKRGHFRVARRFVVGQFIARLPATSGPCNTPPTGKELPDYEPARHPDMTLVEPGCAGMAMLLRGVMARDYGPRGYGIHGGKK